MPHIHMGIAAGFAMYLWWVLFHTMFQFAAIWLHGTRIGQAMAWLT